MDTMSVPPFGSCIHSRVGREHLLEEISVEAEQFVFLVWSATQTPRPNYQ